ncbi:unnamed protein product [Discula destructiva]
MAPIKVAVLDDYQGFAEPIFAKLDASKFDVTIFRDTLLPYNHPATPQAEKDKLVARLEPFPVLCTMRERTPFPAELTTRLPNLKLLLTTGLRNKGLDLPALRTAAVPVAGTRSSGDSTTQHCVALILALARGLVSDDAAVKAGGWQTGVAVPLTSRTLGVLGLGRLGVAVGRIMAVAFGMRVIAWSENLTQARADEQARAAGLAPGAFEVVGRAELFAQADVLSVHVVLSERTKGLVTAEDLGRMRREAIFVNTSRGPIVVDEDLRRVLEEGRIRAAGVDVFEIEPLPTDDPWRTTRWGQEGRSQVVLTPHTGYAEKETFTTWYEQQVANIERWERGQELVDLIY